MAAQKANPLTMNTNTMEKEVDIGPGGEQSGRRKSAFGNRRKSSVVVDETPAAVVEASALNDADRRLAEMGYVQVALPPFYPNLPSSPPLSLTIRELITHSLVVTHRSTNANSPGSPPSPSPSPSAASSPPSAPPSSTPSKPAAPPPPSGAGCSPASDATASPSPSPNSSPHTPPPAVSISPSNTSPPQTGYPK